MLRKSIALILACAATAVAGSALADIDTLTGDHYLFPGQQLQQWCSSWVVYQADGNLVIYDWAGNVGWSSGTYNTSGFVAMQGDGNLVIYDWNYNPLWASGTGQYPGAYAIMQSDGNFVVRDASTHAKWASHTAGFAASQPAPWLGIPQVGLGNPPCGTYGEQMSIYHGWDLPGNDYTHFVMTSRATPEGCAAACAADNPACAAFTYVPAGVQNARPVCWLKSHFAGNWHATSGLASGSREVNSEFFQGGG